MSQCSNNKLLCNRNARWSPKNTAILQLNWLSKGTLSVNFLDWNPFERPSWQEATPACDKLAASLLQACGKLATSLRQACGKLATSLRTVPITS